MEKLKNLWRQRKILIVTIAVVALLVAAVVVCAVIASNRTDPNATPTVDPYTLMYELIGDWKRVDENARGIVELDLHGDQTAVYVTQGVFDAEPVSLETRWQAQAGLLSIVTDGGEVTQFEMEFDGETLILYYKTGSDSTPVAFRR